MKCDHAGLERFDEIRGCTVTVSRCVWCGRWFSFGPAVDTDLTAIEVRAAELAPRFETSTALRISWDEDHGAAVHERGQYPGFVSPGYLAGWLAREIATGDES